MVAEIYGRATGVRKVKVVDALIRVWASWERQL